MNRLLLIAFLSSFAFAVNAEDAAPQPAAAGEVVEITGDSVKPDEAPKFERNCIRQTGSRINRQDRHGCNGLAGSSYTREDLDRTGAMTTAEALERLDPRITIGR
jgi:hypothetical protein